MDLRRFRPRPRAEARAELGLPVEERLLVCAGRMEPLKGMDALIRALPLVLARGVPARVLLIGGDDEDHPAAWNAEQRRLDALRRELGVAERVRFLGAQPQERLPAYFAAADVVAAPSHYESFGLVALEALASGAAVVASRAGGLALTIEDGRSGLLAPPDDHHALAAQILRVLEDPALATALRAGARRRAEEYGWGPIARRIVAIYEQVIAERLAAWTARRPLAQVS
ncbi:MAG: glycosyltransferase [Chloroflexaceae bacterium]|nr:glycosyltransferase [Chloroflexaceae bacterium]